MNFVELWNEEDRGNITEWWVEITGQGNRGFRAELRRAEKPEDVLLSRGFRLLYSRMAGTYWTREENILALAAVGGLLAHIKTNDTTSSFAGACGSAHKVGGKVAVSELRFSQLQKSRTLDELYTRMRRTILLLKGEANVLSVADSVFHWYADMVTNKIRENARNRILVRWGLDYFHAAERTETE